MLTFIKGFESKIGKEMQFTLLAIISVFYVFLNLSGRTDFFPIITILLPSILIIYAIYILTSKHLFPQAHLILLLLTFPNGFGTLMRALFSYHFSLQVWTTPLTWQIIASAIVSLYLIVMVLSFFLNQAYQFSIKPSIYFKPLVLIALYCYFANSLGTMLIVLIPILICLFSNAGYASLMLMLAQVIAVPFTLINLFVTGGIKSTNIFYWLISAAALYLIYLLGKLALEQLHSDEKEQEHI
jgi:hypothetical protein